jgi:hypothetical protein
MKKIMAKFVLRLLQSEQKQHRLEVCKECQQQFQEDPDFLLKVGTGSILLLSLLQDENQGGRFDTVQEIRVETQMVLYTLTKKYFRMHFKSGRDAGICVCSQGDYIQGDCTE